MGVRGRLEEVDRKKRGRCLGRLIERLVGRHRVVVCWLFNVQATC